MNFFPQSEAATFSSKLRSYFPTFVHSHIWIPFRPWRPLHGISGFTLIELMAATTVLSVVLLMMVGMQDQMSKAWSNSNRRTDATREARAAVQTISSDLSGLLTRQKTNMDGYVGSIACTNMGLPFVYSSNGVNSSGLTLPPNLQTNSSFLFGVCTKKSRSSSDPDLAIFGYYIGQTSTTTINGFTNTSYNLYRYVVPSSNTVAALNGVTTGNLDTLFPNIATNSEILARNTCNLRIIFYNSRDAGRPVTNGLNYRVFSASSANNYSGSKIHIELSAYPEDSAQKIPISAWTNTANIQKYARSFEFRIDMPRTISH
jgi:prepilin-type N-terminal cleavage/methylation domain-containing protein